jgi:hypothetical protein
VFAAHSGGSRLRWRHQQDKAKFRGERLMLYFVGKIKDYTWGFFFYFTFCVERELNLNSKINYFLLKVCFGLW